MKIGVISDLHLGYRQYGLAAREEDFYLQYLSCMKKLNAEKVDLIIIAGDLFDKPNPSPKAMNVYRSGIKLLDNIPVVTIKGNHTMLMTKDHFSVDNFFDAEDFNSEYHLLDDETYQKEGVVIQGMYYRSDSNLEDFLDKQRQMADDLLGKIGSFHILVLHQAFKEYCGFTNVDLSIKDIDWSPYDIIICGHIHSHILEQIEDTGSTFFLQPGSIERMNTAEAKDGQENGKGYWIIDTDDYSVGFNPIDFKRDFLLGDIEFDSLKEIEDHFDELKKTCSKMKNPPIISYNYYDNSGNLVHIRELMKDSSKYCLMNNSNVYDMTEEQIVVEISDGEIPTVLDAIKNQESFEENESKLAADIHEAYKNGLDDSVEGLISTYFEKHIKRDYSMDPEVEQMKKDLEEDLKFFENLGKDIDVREVY